MVKHYLLYFIVSSDDVKSYCIRGGLVEHVLKLMENSDTADHLKYGLFRILDNVFQPNAKNVPQECIECLLPIFVRSLKSPDGNVSAINPFCGALSSRINPPHCGRT